jgi:hypothetical protein
MSDSSDIRMSGTMNRISSCHSLAVTAAALRFLGPAAELAMRIEGR